MRFVSQSKILGNTVTLMEVCTENCSSRKKKNPPKRDVGMYVGKTGFGTTLP